MKRVILTVFAFAVVSAGAVIAAAQKATRITFRRGATSAVVTGKLNGYRSEKIFVIRVRKGQTLTTANAGSNYISVGIEAPAGSDYQQDMAADCHDRNEVDRTSAGDYRITVTECRKADRWKGSFKLRVRVR